MYNVILTTFNTGGEPAGTFRLPDLRGRVVAGLDDNSVDRISATYFGNDATNVGDAGGIDGVVLNVDQIPVHSHVTQFYPNGSGAARPIRNAADTSNPEDVASDNTGSGEGHNNMQPTMVMNKIIKT